MNVGVNREALLQDISTESDGRNFDSARAPIAAIDRFIPTTFNDDG